MELISEPTHNWLITFASNTCSSNPVIDRGHTTAAVRDGQMEFQLGPQHFFYNDDVTIRLDPSASLTFNCIGGYIGWDAYQLIMHQVISSLFERGLATRFVRIGLRYVNDFFEMDIQKALKVNLNVEIGEGGKEMLTSYRRLWQDDTGRLINLMVGNELTESPDSPGTILLKAVIDIDVINQGIAYDTIETVMEAVETSHTKEKEIFYGLMNQEFLDSLKPEYE